jgi:hypothetical protein
MALYDPKEFPTEAPAKVSPDFSVAEFLDWARRKPADEEYNYWDTCGCACGQFARDLGFAQESAERYRIEVMFTSYAQPHPRTFGALVKRLEALSK